MPVMKSLTRVWAPKPTASPATPAPASKGPMLTPNSDKITMPVMTPINTNRALRISGSKVRARLERTTVCPSSSVRSIKMRMAALEASQANRATTKITAMLMARSDSRRPRSVASSPQTSNPQIRRMASPAIIWMTATKIRRTRGKYKFARSVTNG